MNRNYRKHFNTNCDSCGRELMHWERFDKIVMSRLREVFLSMGLSKLDVEYCLVDTFLDKVWGQIAEEFARYATDFDIPKYFYIEMFGDTPLIRPSMNFPETLKIECFGCLEMQTPILN